MLLILDDMFRVSKDSSNQNFQLEKLEDIKEKKTGEVIRQEFKIIGYHGNSMRSVLLQYKNESVISDDRLKTINDVLNLLNIIDNTINAVVKRENIKLDD